MTKTNFIKLYEELSYLNENLKSDYNALNDRFNKINAQLDSLKANTKYGNIIKSYIDGYTKCATAFGKLERLIAEKSISEVAVNTSVLSEMDTILNKLDYIIGQSKLKPNDLVSLFNEFKGWNFAEFESDVKSFHKSDAEVILSAFSTNMAANTETSHNEESDAPQEKATTEPKNAKLNKARQANLKIIKAFKEIGLSTDDLTVTAKNKNGKEYRKASDKLNKLRKTLFGESLTEETEEDLIIEE